MACVKLQWEVPSRFLSWWRGRRWLEHYVSLAGKWSPRRVQRKVPPFFRIRARFREGRQWTWA